MTNNEYQEKIKDMLVRSREDAMKSQKQMSDMIGVHERTIQNWEACVSQPDPSQIIKWFDVLHADIIAYYLMIFDCCNPLDTMLNTIILRLPAEYKEALYKLHKIYGLEALIDLRNKEIEVLLLNEKHKTPFRIL